MKKIKKSVLIPMAKFEQLQNSTPMNSNNNVEHISKSIKLDANIKQAAWFQNEMSSVMNNPHLDVNTKLQLYLRAIKNFVLFRDKGLAIKNQPQLVRIVNGNQKNNESINVNTQHPVLMEKVVDKESLPNSSSFYDNTVVDNDSIIEQPSLDSSVEFIGDVSPTRSIIKQSEIGIKNVDEIPDLSFRTESDILTGLKGVWKTRGKELLGELVQNPNIKWNKRTGQIAIRNLPFSDQTNIKDLIHFEVLKRKRDYKSHPAPSGYQEFKTFLKQNQISPAKSSRALRLGSTKKTTGALKSVKRQLLPTNSSTPKRTGTIFSNSDSPSTSIGPLVYEAY
jgi:hypothetical protein